MRLVYFYLFYAICAYVYLYVASIYVYLSVSNSHLVKKSVLKILKHSQETTYVGVLFIWKLQAYDSKNRPFSDTFRNDRLILTVLLF